MCCSRQGDTQDEERGRDDYTSPTTDAIDEDTEEDHSEDFSD